MLARVFSKAGRGLPLLLALVAGLLGAVPPAVAAAPYVVSGVEVDVTAADPSTARDQAITEGQRKALQKLLEEQLGAEKAATIRKPSDAEIANMVQDFEVESERSSSVRYIGVMTFRFAADQVDALTGRSGGATLTAVPDPALPGAAALPSGPARTLSVSVPIGSLKDWTEVRRRIATVPAVRRADLRYLSRNEARLDLLFAGDEIQLGQALAQRQLALVQAQQQWVLTLGDTIPPAAADAPAVSP